MAAMTTTAVAMPVNSQARKRKTMDSERDERPRGRPRKSSKDESAAERRRTQIRIAQRAYRQRKESTIERLNSRVLELTATVEMMNRALHDFARHAIARGLQSDTKNELEALISRFAPVVTEARDPGENAHAAEEDAVVQNISAVAVDPMQGSYHDVNGSPSSDHVDIGLGYAWSYERPPGPHYQTAQDEQSFGPPPTSHISPVAHVDPEAAPSQYGYTGHDMGPKEQQLESHLNQISQPFLDTLQYETSLVPRSVNMPVVHSYSNFEKSFARRLQRRCIEIGWELINNPSNAPHTFNRVFRLPRMLGRSQISLKHAFSVAIRRTINDTLDSSVSPLSHVGGAGLHYPDDKSGCRRSGAKSEHSRMLDMIASNVPGFEGVWLDPHDVQGYLHEKGIKVDGAATYVHARLPLSYLTSPAHTISMESFMTGTDPYSYKLQEAEAFHRLFLSQFDEQNATVMNGSDLGGPIATTTDGNVHTSPMGVWNTDLPGVNLGSLNDLINSPGLDFFTTPGGVGQASVAPVPHQHDVAFTCNESQRASSARSSPGPGSGSSASIACSVSSASSVQSMGAKNGIGASIPPLTDELLTVTIDTNKLVKGLLMGSVCLGRAPGFRRELVDAAIRASIVMSI